MVLIDLSVSYTVEKELFGFLQLVAQLEYSGVAVDFLQSILVAVRAYSRMGHTLSACWDAVASNMCKGDVCV